MEQDKIIKEQSNSSDQIGEESMVTEARITSTDNERQDIAQPKNSYIENKRMIMLPLISSVLLGAYFNGQFQSFIKEQLMDSMNMSSSDYSWFVLIPTLPNIPLPLFVGPLLDQIGARRGLLLFTFMLSIGMSLCMISIQIDSILMIIIGKTFLQIAVECQGIAHGCIAGKWFTSKGLATAFTVTSLLCKMASSTSGIIYPQMFDISDSLMAPLALGTAICGATLFIAITIFYLDRNSEKFNPTTDDVSAISGDMELIQKPQKKKFQLKDFKKFDKMFWLYAIQCPMMFGAFYAFMNYLQSIFIHKFMIEKTLAGELVSVPYWIAFSTPIFGLLADRFGYRCLFLVFTTFASFISVTILYFMPVGENNALVYTALIIFGIFLSAMCAFLYPTLPLLSQKNLLSTAFAICYATKNGGTALLNYLGGMLIGSDDMGYNSFLLTYTILFFISFLLSIVIYFYDRKHGSIINSAKPQRYIDYVAEKRAKRIGGNYNDITKPLNAY